MSARVVVVPLGLKTGLNAIAVRYDGRLRSLLGLPFGSTGRDHSGARSDLVAHQLSQRACVYRAGFRVSVPNATIKLS